MLYNIKLTAAQVKAIAEWCQGGSDMAPVYLSSEYRDDVIVAQGDDRARFMTSGVEIEP